VNRIRRNYCRVHGCESTQLLGELYYDEQLKNSLRSVFAAFPPSGGNSANLYEAEDELEVKNWGSSSMMNRDNTGHGTMRMSDQEVKMLRRSVLKYLHKSCLNSCFKVSVGDSNDLIGAVDDFTHGLRCKSKLYKMPRKPDFYLVLIWKPTAVI